MQNIEDNAVDPWIARSAEEEEAVEVNAIPNRGLQVEAASLALLRSDTKGSVADYQETMGRSPTDAVRLIQKKQAEINGQMTEAYTNALYPILSDPNTSFEDKEGALAGVRDGSVIPKDTTDSLATEALVSPSEGESVQGEAVRMTMAEELGLINRQRRELQELVNASNGAQSQHSRKLLEMLEMFLPGEGGITAGKIAKSLGGNNSAAAAFLLPGTARKNLSESIEKMPHNERVEMAKQMATIMQDSSGLLLDSNSLRMNQWVNDVIMGNVSNTDEWIDNVFNVLDLVGIGSMFKAAPRAVKGVARRAQEFSTEARGASRDRMSKYDSRVDPEMERAGVPSDVNLTGDAAARSTPQVPDSTSRIAQIEDEIAENLGDAGGVLEKGTVTALQKEREALLKTLKTGGLPAAELRKPGAANKALERRQDIQAQVQRIDDQLSNNAAAIQAQERLSGLEVELSSLRKNQSNVDAQLNPVVAALRKNEMESVMGVIAPRSAYSVMQTVNPGQARSLHASIILGSDDVALPLTGATKNEVALKAVAPQVASPNGVVNKVPTDMEETIRQVFTSQLGQVVRNTMGGVAFTARELETARAARVNDYKTVAGLTINDAMTTVGGEGTKIKFAATYGNAEGGWLKAEDAVAQAKESLRKQGVTDSNIEVLKTVGSELHPVKLEDVKGVDGEYFIRIKMEEDIRAYDIKDWDELDVKRNLLDYLETSGTNKQGSANRMVFTPDATLDKTIVNGFSVADDKSAKLSSAFTELFETNFSTPYTALPKARRNAVDAYLKEANLKELKFDRIALSNRFSAAEVDVIEGWKKSWDAMWVFENLDLVRSLNKDNFMLFEHPNLRAVVSENPGAKKRYDKRVAYDPSIDQVRTLTDAEINDIYRLGGNVGDFRRPINILGKDVDHIIIRNKGTEVARKVNETDRMLEYRDGYYQVFYKNPRFIEEIGVDGKKVTIGITESAKEAERLTNQLKAQNPGKSYKHRGDERGINRSSDVYWDMQHVGGRLAQRHRGQLLQSSVGTKQMGAMDMIETPADSAVRAAHSIGGRMAMRETLDIAKTRFLEQYKDVLKHENGLPQFPAKRDDIYMEGEATNWRLADARTTWEHIRYMENGYINAMDATVKNALNSMATAAGMKGYDTVEKVLRAGADVNITGTIKGGVFASMLASNPLRQFLVQPNQSLRMLAYNPSGMLSLRVPSMVTDVLKNKMLDKAGLAKGLGPEAQEFYTWFRETGMEQAITRGNLIRGTMLEAADRTNFGSKVHDNTVGVARKIGYDAAEMMNLLIHSAFVWDKYKQSGKAVDNPVVREEMHAVSRGVTLNMNFAGDMPYNQNALALVMTYMQVPHKFMLSAANRQLSRSDRARLLAADLTFWGTPLPLVYNLLDQDLPVEDEWMREFLSDGLMSVVMNGMFTMMAGEKVGSDWSSLAPYDMDSWYKHGENLMFDGGIQGMISNTPTARVFGLSADSRLGMALKTTAGFFADIADVDLDTIPPADITDVANAWLSMSSGWSNFQKARAAWFLGEMRDKHGRLTDDDTHRIEAAIQAFGFSPMDVRKFYDTQKLNQTGSKTKPSQEVEDMKQFNTMVVSMVNGDVRSEKAVKLYANMIASKGWMPDKRTQKEQLYRLQQAWDETADSKVKDTLFKQIIQMPSVDTTIDPIRNAPISQQDQERLEQTFLNYRTRFETLQKQAEEDIKRK